MKAKPTRNSGEVILEIHRQDEEMLSRAISSPLRIKEILVPIDFSDCAKKALRYAIPLAKEHKAAITLLYVLPRDYAAGEYGGIDYATLQADGLASGEGDLATLALDEVRGEVSTDTLVRSGSPAFEIIEAAK